MDVVIAGGGVAGLEGALALSALAEDLVDIELVSPGDEFVYRPLLVAEPFGAADVLRIDLGRVAGDTGARHTKDALASVDPSAHEVTTRSGSRVGYDALLVTLGAQPVEVVPGALTFGDAAERQRFASLLGTLGRTGMRRLAFVVPPAANWSIAAYELAFLTAAERDARRLPDIELTLVTHEDAPLDAFGRATAELVATRLEEAGILLRTACRAERFEDGELSLSAAGPISVDAAVALPGLEVPPLPGLPQRHNGFVQTDTSMRVAGLEDVWAAGDATWFPVKQGGLATQQADVAARAIAARAGAHVPIQTFRPVLRAVLATGGAPEFLRSSRSDPAAAARSTGRALWWPPTKLAGAYLGPYIERALGGDYPQVQLLDLEPPADPDADAAEHGQAVSLVLAAADADAGGGDFEGALRWLSFAGQLNLVIPPTYVARRHEWRRRLQPGLAPDAAASRIDPSFASTAEAITDLERRIGWLREIQNRNQGEMRSHLDAFDAGMEHLIAQSRRTSVVEARS